MRGPGPERIQQLQVAQGAGRTWPVVVYEGVLEIAEGRGIEHRIIGWAFHTENMVVGPIDADVLWNYLVQRFPHTIVETTGLEIPALWDGATMCPSCEANDSCFVHDDGEL